MLGCVGPRRRRRRRRRRETKLEVECGCKSGWAHNALRRRQRSI
jgi:hypothetical protein